MNTKGPRNIKTIITHAFLLIFAFIQVYPIFWLFEFSLKDNSEIFGGNIAGLPEHWRKRPPSPFRAWEVLLAVLTPR